jgi:hypothetical protein
MMRPDELFGKDKGSLRRDSSCQNQKEKTMPSTVSTQAISDLGPKLVRAEPSHRAATIFFLDAGAMNLSTKGAIITGE